MEKKTTKKREREGQKEWMTGKEEEKNVYKQ